MVIKVNWRNEESKGRGERGESVAGTGMTIKCPRGRWEIYMELRRPIQSTMLHRAGIVQIFGNETGNGNRRCEDQPHILKPSIPFRSPVRGAGMLKDGQKRTSRDGSDADREGRRAMQQVQAGRDPVAVLAKLGTVVCLYMSMTCV